MGVYFLESSLTCNDNLCQHGGNCTNLPKAAQDLVGFRCVCPEGFTGYLCEKVDKCAGQPCKNGGICQNFGSKGYVCQCIDGYTGYDCMIREFNNCNFINLKILNNSKQSN